MKGKQEELYKNLGKRDAMKEHTKDLALALSQLINNLQIGQKYKWMQDEAINDIVVSQEEREQLEKIDQVLARCLLSHIQADLPELGHLKNWRQLRVGEITDELLHKLSVMRWQKEFKGTCEICQGWQK